MEVPPNSLKGKVGQKASNLSWAFLMLINPISLLSQVKLEYR